VRATYQTAAGGRIEGDVLDISAGGLFIGAENPMSIGQRLSLEIRLAGEATAWSALGRVVWRRDASGVGPQGMGVKLIDLETSAVATIERLVASRERTEPGTGGAGVPARERTILGVGTSDSTAAPAAPILSVATSREATVLGVGGAAAPSPSAAAQPEAAAPEPLVASEPRDALAVTGAPPAAPPAPSPRPLDVSLDASVALDLVVRKPEPPKPISDVSLAAAGVPRRRGRAWIVVLVLLGLATAGTWVMRARIPWHRLSQLTGLARDP
jgi:Tfp pilus assembly protein PilZ